MKRLAWRSLLITALLLGSSPSKALAYPMYWTGLGKGESLTWSLAGDPLGNPFSDFAGELTWTWGGAPPPSYPDSFYTYCVDATQYLYSGQNAAVLPISNLTNTSGGPKSGEEIAWLFDTYAASVHATGSNDDAAALQIAIWKVLYDTPANFSLSQGNFKLLTTGAVYNEATADLNALVASLQDPQATWLYSPSGQSQVTTPAVPEPASLVLLGSGLATVGGYLRRRRLAEKRRPIERAG